MHWTTATFVFAGLFPLVTVVALAMAWRHGRRWVLMVLSTSLLAAAVHAAVSGVSVLVGEWVAIGVFAGFCGLGRFRTRTVVVLGAIGLLFGERMVLDAWWNPGERFTALLGGCPVAFDRSWWFEATGENYWQLKEPRAGPDSGRTPELIGGVVLASVGSDIPAAGLVLEEESPAIVLSDASIEILGSAHEEMVFGFIESAGFGFRRMTPHLAWPDVDLPMECPPPDEIGSGATVSGEAVSGGRAPEGRASEKTASNDDSPALAEGPASAENFVGPKQADKAAKSRWVADRVQLVGLLKSETPRVYQVQGAPQMETLDSVATRPLDAFESAALGQLRSGETLVTSPRKEGIRMVGAIRASEECLACHAVKTGTLLGAFTYHLRPARLDPQRGRRAPPPFLYFDRPHRRGATESGSAEGPSSP